MERRSEDTILLAGEIAKRTITDHSRLKALAYLLPEEIDCYVDGEKQTRESINFKDASVTVYWKKIYLAAATPKRMEVMLYGRQLNAREFDIQIINGDTLKTSYTITV